jgi:hypothetical protein
MQNFEYLQISINYYSAPEQSPAASINEEVVVWKDLQNYLEILNSHGWVIINETKTAKGQSRTYQFKRLVEGNSE